MAPSSPTNFQSISDSMESNSGRIHRKLRPESTIGKNKILSSIMKERAYFAEYTMLTSEDGHYVSAFEDFSKDSFVYDGEDKVSGEKVPSDDAMISLAGFDHELEESNDFPDCFEEGSDVVDELQEMIDSCDEDECSSVKAYSEEEDEFEEPSDPMMAADFEPAGSLLDCDEEFVAGHITAAEHEQNAFVEAEVAENRVLGNGIDFLSIAAPPALDEI